ncbi:MAG TPA: hypothetical protein VHL30_00050 [Chlamydiales bacterium]|jgi:hypothetical protein|nr:hypothetical protein [Chlamydiales bacterium]
MTAPLNIAPLLDSANIEKSQVEVYLEKSFEVYKEVAEKVNVFIEKHFILILFTISCIALIAASPFSMISGSLVGALIHWHYEPNLWVKEKQQVITTANTAFAVLGAMAALVQLAPVGPGGLICCFIPWLASLTIGSTAYRSFCHFFPRNGGSLS